LRTGFSSVFYWSSSEYGGSNAWFQFFMNGSQYDYGKGNSIYVRPVRAF
jgi:hypothetical protein